MKKETFYKATILALAFMLIAGLSYAYGEGFSQAESEESQVFRTETPLAMASTRSDLSGNPQDYFADFENWPSSTTRKSGDYIPDVLYLSQEPGQNAYHGFSDINGDGLVDMLYYQLKSIWVDDGYQHGLAFAVFVNTGENNFEEIYKCLGSEWTGLWYGDCAE